MIINTRNLSEIPKSSNALIADGIFTAKVKHAEVKPTQSGGKLLKLQFLLHAGEVIHDRATGQEIPNKGKVIFDQISLTPTENWDPDVKVAELARGVKWEEEQISVEGLIGRWVRIKVAYRAGKDGYEDQNIVKGYLPTPSDFSAPTE